MEETKPIYVRKMPVVLYREAKAAAALEGKILREWIIEAMKEKLRKEE